MLPTQRGPKRGRARARSSNQRIASSPGRNPSSGASSSNRSNGQPSTTLQAARGATRGNALRGNRGPSNRGRGRGAFKAAGSAPSKQQSKSDSFTTVGKGDWQQRYQLLRTHREKEREEAMRNGFIADPDRPRRLEDAITPVGTCQDMCAEFERTQRVVQMDVWGPEKTPDKSGPDESRMVKKFRRAAAGVDEQLPSDLRPPPVLKRTLDFLFHDVVFNADALADVHHFVWDRTRAIRNDFSIQQISRGNDLLIAIECFERIARFHILSLHHFAGVSRPYDQYTAQQEREQLDKTLLSLMQYYDDSRAKLKSLNEPEFRAYCIIFQIQSPMPNLPARMHHWPAWIVTHSLVRTAIKLYEAASNTFDPQGPLQPSTEHLVAQENWREFWKIIESDEVSYLMACVAEIYFPMVRQTVVRNIWIGCRKGGAIRKNDDWSLDDLTYALGMDYEDSVQELMEQYGFTITEHEDGVAFVDLGSVQRLPDITVKANASHIVERKRKHRFFPTVVDGISVSVAKAEGNVSADESDDEMVADEDVDGLSAPVSQQNGTVFGSTTMQPAATSPFATDFQAKAQNASNSSAAPFAMGAESDPATGSFASASSQNFGQSSFGATRSDINNDSSAKPSSFASTSEKHNSQPAKVIDNGKDHTWKQGSAITFGSISSATAPNALSDNENPKPTTNTFSFGQPNSSAAQTPNPAQPTMTNSSTPSSDLKNQSGGSLTPQQTDTTTADQAKQKSPFAPQMYRPKHSSPLSRVSFTPVESTEPDNSLRTSESMFPQSQKEDIFRPAPNFKTVPNPFAPSSTPTQPSQSTPAANTFASVSFSQPANIPKEPSSNPFSFAQNSASMSTSHAFGLSSASPTPSSRDVNFVSSAEQPSPQPAPPKAQRDPYEHLTRIVLLEEHGLFEQIIQRMAESMYEEVQQVVVHEKDLELAKEFRTRSLAQRYGLRWRHIWWSRRMSRLGAEQRRRRKLAHEERARTKRESPTARHYKSFLQSESQRRMQSSMKSSMNVSNNASPTADSFGASLLTNDPVGSSSIVNDNQAQQADDKVLVQPSAGSGIDALRESFRPKPAPPDHVIFPNGPTPQNKTNSLYWYLRSQGYDPNSLPLTSNSNGSERKRPRDNESYDRNIRPQKRSPNDVHDQEVPPVISQAQLSIEGSPSTSRRPSVTKSDELLAQLRKVREQLAEGAAWFKDQNARLSASPSPSSSPDLSASGKISKYRQMYGGVLEENRSRSVRGSPLRPASSSAGTSSQSNRVSKFLTHDQYASILNSQRKDMDRSTSFISRHSAPLSQPRQSWLDKLNARTEAAKQKILKDAEEERQRIADFYGRPQGTLSSGPALPKAKDVAVEPKASPFSQSSSTLFGGVRAPATNGTNNAQPKPAIFGAGTGLNVGSASQPVFGAKQAFEQPRQTASFGTSNNTQSVFQAAGKNPFISTQAAASTATTSPDRRLSPPPLKRPIGSQPSPTPTPKRPVRAQNNYNKFAGLEVEGGSDEDEGSDADSEAFHGVEVTGQQDNGDAEYDADSNEETEVDGDDDMAEEDEEEEYDDDNEQQSGSMAPPPPRRFGFDMNAGTSEADAITLDSD